MLNEVRVHLEEFNYIGFTETFDEDMLNIFSRLGINRTARPSRTNIGEPKPRAQDLPPSTRDRLQRTTELDRVLYDDAISLRRSGLEGNIQLP